MDMLNVDECTHVCDFMYFVQICNHGDVCIINIHVATIIQTIN